MKIKTSVPFPRQFKQQIRASVIMGLALFCVQVSGSIATSAVQKAVAKIHDGSRAVNGEFPFAVQVRITENYKEGQCGGSIISPNIILTAAHCTNFRRYTIDVVAGEIRWKQQGDTAQFRTVTKVIKHENYNSITKRNDLAILILSKPLEFNKNVQPIKIPHLDQEFKGTAEICGWGKLAGYETGYHTHDLRKADVPLISDDLCRQEWPLNFDSQTMMCAGGNLTDTCAGDSGAPLVCATASGPYLCGITSWGIRECGKLFVPGVYTRVSKYTPWIERKIMQFHSLKNSCPGQFDCGNGRCISNSSRCNGINECGKGEDEAGCPGYCRPDEFRCADGKCVKLGAVCNDKDDCGDGSDEMGCGTCPVNKFRCPNFACVAPGPDCDLTDCYEAQCFEELVTITNKNLTSSVCRGSSTFICLKNVGHECLRGFWECHETKQNETLSVTDNKNSTLKSLNASNLQTGSSNNSGTPSTLKDQNHTPVDVPLEHNTTIVTSPTVTPYVNCTPAKSSPPPTSSVLNSSISSPIATNSSVGVSKAINPDVEATEEKLCIRRVVGVLASTLVSILIVLTGGVLLAWRYYNRRDFSAPQGARRLREEVSETRVGENFGSASQLIRMQ